MRVVMRCWGGHRNQDLSGYCCPGVSTSDFLTDSFLEPSGNNEVDRGQGAHPHVGSLLVYPFSNKICSEVIKLIMGYRVGTVTRIYLIQYDSGTSISDFVIYRYEKLGH